MTMERSLVVLDDPWLPEQVRYLNPVDGSQTDQELAKQIEEGKFIKEILRIQEKQEKGEITEKESKMIRDFEVKRYGAPLLFNFE